LVLNGGCLAEISLLPFFGLWCVAWVRVGTGGWRPEYAHPNDTGGGPPGPIRWLNL